MVNRIYFNKHKCFDNDSSFDKPSLVNLVIGKNNSGKSTFLDIVDGVYNIETPIKSLPEISIEYLLEPDEIKRIINQSNYVDGYEPYRNEIKRMLQNTPFVFSFHRDKNKSPYYDSDQTLVLKIQEYCKRSYFDCGIVWSRVLDLCKANSEFATYKVFKISAERDVVPEKEADSFNVQSNGRELTNAFIHNYLEKSGNKKLLNQIKDGINDILKGEEEFETLKVQRENKYYSIALTNKYGDINLEDMGSGLKTIVFVLYSLYSSVGQKTLFMFEELENNLHPEIQRRLFNKIYDFAIEHNTPIYITSHSHVAINCFYGKARTSVYHICKQDGKSTIEIIDSDMSKSQILDDLGVKASDLFQTNGVIWVEGPSDRIYIKSWLKLVAPELIENTHFTFLYYGGKLLSHFSLDKNNNQAINILLENRHSAIVIDSDKKSDSDEISDTKQRIQNEFNNRSMFCWITKGKEIENYISKNALEKKYSGNEFVQIGQYELFPKYITCYESNFLNEKVGFAHELVFENSDLYVLDLNQKIIELANVIKRWNSL